MSGKLIIIDDEPDLLVLLEHTLKQEGFDVRCASSGVSALEVIREWMPDAIILDVMLPEVDGFDLCRILRGDSRTKGIPILFVSALVEEQNILTALEIGGSDYITKPFSPRVLAAKVRKLLEFAYPSSGATQTEGTRGLVVDLNRFDVRYNDASLGMTRMELRIVQLLCRQPGVAFSREKIVEMVNGEDYAVTERSVDVHIASIRKKLGEAASLVETVRGFGYRLDDRSPVSVIGGEALSAPASIFGK